MFRFNPDSPHAWLDAVDRHRQGQPDALASMIRGGKPMPDSVREYVADAVARAPRPKGRPAKVLAAKDIYRAHRIYGRFHQLRTDKVLLDDTRIDAATYAETVTTLAEEFGVNETDVARIVRPSKGDGPEK